MKPRFFVLHSHLSVIIFLITALAACGGGGSENPSGGGVSGVSTCVGSSSVSGSGSGSSGPSSGGALDFDGVDDYVDVGTWDVAGTAMTIALWFRADDYAVPDARLIAKSTSTAERDHYFMLSTIQSGGTRLRFRLKTDGTTDTLVASSGTLTVGEWIHAVAVYDGATMRLYKDGVEVGSMAKTGLLSTDDTVKIRIAQNPDGNGSFDGHMDDVRVYDRALTLAEIQVLVAGTADPAAPPLAHWKFDEGAGVTAFDSSGNGNHGTVDGATWVLLGQFNGGGTAMLSWTPPVTNTDNSPVTDLAGYKIYYGTSPGIHPNVITVLCSTGISEYSLENLPVGTWYFAVSAFDFSGNESAKSNEASKTIN